MKTYTLQELQDRLPEFIDDRYPKESKERGIAIVAIALYTMWLREKELNV